MKWVNLTSQDITLFTISVEDPTKNKSFTIPKSGVVVKKEVSAPVFTSNTYFRDKDGKEWRLPTYQWQNERTLRNKVVNLPIAENGVFLIVSQDVIGEISPLRYDVFAPGEPVLGTKGKVIGYLSLQHR